MSVKKEGGKIFVYLEDLKRYFYVRRSEFLKIIAAPVPNTFEAIKPYLEF